MSTQPTSSPATPTRKPLLRNRAARRFVLAVEILALLLVVLGLATTLWLRHALHASLPQLDGELHVSGLTAPVTITRDSHGVPSIAAANLDDLLFAQGFLTAQDRLWQMDVLRRHAAGTLAELLGPSLIDHDRMQRYLQIRAAADRALTTLPADQLHQLDAYARGVNAYIDSHPDTLPVEFHALRYDPAPWSPRDTLLVALVMNQDLTTRFPEKLNREALTAHLPADIIADMYPVGSWRDHPPTQSTNDLTTPTGEIEQVPLDNSQSLNRATPHDLLTHYAALSRKLCEGCRAGSNDWVVAGSRTATGAPLLSDDMHLSLTAPDIWYEAALHVTDGSLDVAGFTLPGVPFVIVGRNQYVAWGFTNTGADVQDVYIEHLRGEGQQTEYAQPNGAWPLAEHHTELIRVRGGRDINLDVLTTTHTVGTTVIQTPIISPLYKTDRRALSLAWNVYDPTTVTEPLLAIDTAKDAASLVAAFANFGSPSQNLVYADAQHIGYHALGRVPIRGPNVKQQRAVPQLIAAPAPQAGDDSEDTTQLSQPAAIQQPAAPIIDYTIGSPLANVPVDALDASQQWSGYIPYDQLPAVLDPTSGIIATANSRITPTNYPYFFADDWVDPYRVERIHRLLDGRTGLKPADMLAIQTDIRSDFDLAVAQRLAYALDHASPAALSHDAKRLHQAADLLRNWKGDLTPDSSAAAIAVATRAELWPMLLQGQLRARGITEKKSLAELSALYTWEEKNTALENLLLHQPKRWLPADVPTWNDLLTLAVTRALKHAPHNLAEWKYGDYHPVEIAHPVFGSQSFLSLLLGARTGTGLQPNSGDGNTVKQTGLHFGPSERFTADLSNPENTFANITTGESGNPASPWFMDQFNAWLHGATFTLPLHQTEATHTLTLTPKP
jgi:penicillin amidase